MTDYTKSTNFATKDSLPAGSALKIVRGTEIDTEFNNIATAVATKTDNASAAITGGSITGITDLAVADGGTGASTAAGARTNLGLVIGTNVQAWDADLDTWATKTAPSGTVVGTTDTQTLTNKIIQGGAITSGTSVASTSGTSIDFTSIPSWVKRITVMLNGVSTNGTSAPLIQIGSGSVTTTGYLSSGAGMSNGATTSAATATNGFILIDAVAAARAYTFIVTLVLQTGNAWCLVSNGHAQTIAQTTTSSGSITLGGTLDRVRITTAGGTDTFDAGSINILYE